MGQNELRPLSPRQQQCLQGVADHLDSHQIAHRLGLSPHTVDGHITAAIAALGASSRRDAVRIWETQCQSDAGKRLTGQFPPVDYPTALPPDPSRSVVRDSSAPSDFEAMPMGMAVRQGGRDERHNQALKRLAFLVGIAAGIAVLLIAGPELGHGAQALANLIQPFRQHQ